MPSYATGPSNRVSRGPVVGAYAEGDAISRACANCGAEVGSFCRRLDGTSKPVPCCTRLKAADDTKDAPIAPRANQTAAIGIQNQEENH